MFIKSLAHICLYTADLAASLRFYCDALGMRKQFDFTRKGRLYGCYLQAGNNTFIELFEVDKPTAGKPEGITHFCLETDDMEGLHRRLAEAGYQPEPIKLGCDNSYQFWIKDPNGIHFEFHQYTPESAQFREDPVEVPW